MLVSLVEEFLSLSQIRLEECIRGRLRNWEQRDSLLLLNNVWLPACGYVSLVSQPVRLRYEFQRGNLHSHVLLERYGRYY